MRFASLFSGGFITAIVLNLPERRLAKRTSVHCTSLASEQYKQLYIIKKYLLNALHMAMLFKPTIIGNYSLPKQLKINHFYAKFGLKYILYSMYL